MNGDEDAPSTWKDDVSLKDMAGALNSALLAAHDTDSNRLELERHAIGGWNVAELIIELTRAVESIDWGNLGPSYYCPECSAGPGESCTFDLDSTLTATLAPGVTVHKARVHP